MTCLRSLLALFAVALLLIAGSGPAGAQVAPSEAKLAAFIEAAVTVNRLRDFWTPKIGAAQSETEAEGLIEQANAQMRQAIERADGITLQEYMEIAQAADRDPALSDKLQEMFQQKVGQ